MGIKFKKGDKLKCLYARDILQLTTGKTYIALGDQQAGIFASRPFITVKDDGLFKGDKQKAYTCHASRFELLDDLNK